MYKLREDLDSFKDIDEIFIDTPPALNFYTRSALIAADTCLIPFDCDDFSRRALYTPVSYTHLDVYKRQVSVPPAPPVPIALATARN